MTIPRKELVWAGEALGRHIRIEATSGFWPEFAVTAAGLEEDWWEQPKAPHSLLSSRHLRPSTPEGFLHLHRILIKFSS